MSIFRTVDLEALEKINPESLIVDRVIARLWQTAQFETARGRTEKASRAEQLAMRFEAFKKGSQNGATKSDH